MDAGQTWPEPLGAPPPAPPEPPEFPPDPQTSGEGFLHQQLSFPNPTNPSSNFYHYQYNSIESQPKVQEITPHGNVYADQPPAAALNPLDGAAALADPTYSYNVNGCSSVAMAAVDWVYGGEDPRTIAAKEAIRLYGAHPVSSLSRPWKVPKSNKFSKKNSKKKKTLTKVVQAAYCEVCKVDCNSQDVLKSHSEGKKHKKKLKQQEDTIKREAAAAVAVAEKAEAGEPAVTEDRTADESEKLDVDLETKRSKILESGGYVDEVRVCTICNIAVNSQKVFEYHLEGQKHAAMAEKALGDLSSEQLV